MPCRSKSLDGPVLGSDKHGNCNEQSINWTFDPAGRKQQFFTLEERHRELVDRLKNTSKLKKIL
jgi:hypothetical protein